MIWHPAHERLKHIRALVSNDAAYLETILKVESDSKHVTYGELIDLCDASLKKRTEFILELRALGIAPETKSLLDLLNSEQDMVRSKLSFYRSQMDLANQMGDLDRLSERVLFYESERKRGDLEYRLNATRAAIELVKEQISRSPQIANTAGEVADKVREFAKVYADCLGHETDVVHRFPELRRKPVAMDYEKANHDLANERAATAERIRKLYM